MEAAGVSSSVRGKLSERCSLIFPDLSDRANRLSWGLKLSMVLLHVIFVGVLLLFDVSLIRRTREQPWYAAAYLVVLAASLFQYFYTSCSSPGYVVDAMREANGTPTTFNNPTSILKQSNSRDGNIIHSMTNYHLEAQTTHLTSSSWLKLVMDLYPPGSAIRNWTCTYCNIVQPPRAKHCHDCDKCILQFDHHCVWLGTCVGQGNHCRFWWYIFLETILSYWTVVLYISYLRSEIEKAWWKDFIVIVLLAALVFCLIFLNLLLLFHSYLALTNQTTYEKVRRRRILYLRGIPEKVHPFSKGICKNVYTFCCSGHSIRDLEAVPTMEDIEARARPYTCLDVVMCRCC
ncbi:protein S-acyltransferase 10-like [Curcuma longa]|uniref:protein S-acyltransferase 10-like n=1 Tax=Curcuma longa TaxID=136217 RepID=UPI003D9E7D81